MPMHRDKGFTLIELLVVIAIIGILSSVVLASLNSARGRGADSSVKAAMNQMQSQAQNYLDTNSNFGISVSDCSSGVFADPRFAEIITNVLANAAAGAAMTCATDSIGAKWAAGVSALKGAGTTWCTDNSTGWFKPGTVNAAAGTCQ